MDIFTHIQEATTKQLQRKQKSVTRLFPTFPDRVKAVADNGGIRLKDVEPELWTFKIHSGTKKNVWYDAYLKFKNILPTLEKLVKDRRLWVGDKSRVDRKKLARKFMTVVNVELKCGCPAFQYWGPAYVLSLGKYDAKYTDDEKRPPRIRNPKQYGAYCKHLENLMKVLPFYNDTMIKFLSDFYSEQISTFEQEAKKELGFVKKAAKALKKKFGRKKEEETEKEETKESIKEGLTKIEREVKKKYKTRLNKPLTPAKGSGRLITNDPDEVGWLKFWLLKDGTIIPVRTAHMEIVDSEEEPYWTPLLHSGALVGYINGSELGFLQGRKRLTSEQISKLKQIYVQYHPSILTIDSRVIDDFKARIDSLDKLDYLLKYGKEGIEERKKKD